MMISSIVSITTYRYAWYSCFVCLFDATVVSVQITSRVLFADECWEKLIDCDCVFMQIRALKLQPGSYAALMGMYALVTRCALPLKPVPK